MSTGLRARHHRLDPPLPTPPLPRDVWVGPIFIEADGTELESVWDGRDQFKPTLWSEGPIPTARRYGIRRGGHR